MHDKITPILLQYLEPEWTEKTRACLQAAGFDHWIEVSREGVGSMSKAFNRAHDQFYHDLTPYVWFVTNVTFAPDVPQLLYQAMEAHPLAAAAHPAMRNSDHPHIREITDLQVVSFIEWTAPLVRLQTLRQIGWLNEGMGYVHFDMEWSYRAKNHGWKLLVEGRAEVAHRYLHSNHIHPISEIRQRLRAYHLDSSARALADAMGFGFQSLPDAETKARRLLG